MKSDMKLYTANCDNFEIDENKMRKGNGLVQYGTSLSEYYYKKQIMSDPDIFQNNAIVRWISIYLTHPNVNQMSI